MRVLCVIVFLAAVAQSMNAQKVDAISVLAGISYSDFSISPHKNYTEATTGYVSTYAFDVLATCNIRSSKFYYSFGVTSGREQIGFYPDFQLKNISEFSKRNDSVRVFEFRAWTYPVGIPLRIGFKAFNGWAPEFPIIIIPATNFHVTLTNNFRTYTGYRGVLMSDEQAKEEVGRYYTTSIADHNMVVQIGADLFFRPEYVDFGVSFSWNYYLISPYRISARSRTSFDFKAFVQFKFKKMRDQEYEEEDW
jgi:hypothetical protein